MSGFLAMLELAGEPVDETLLTRLAGRMTYRGPHGCAVETIGPVGLAHTLLQIGDEAHDAPQPRWLDRRCCLTADARIDDRRRLVTDLEAASADLEASSAAAPTFSGKRPRDLADADLIAHSYVAWGPAAVERLLGDFAFALWDAENKRLFCARDPFGVKPLYYATFGTTFMVSNSIRCLRAHPRADDRLDERAIADYLIFSFNRYADRSSFAQIRRLPPAHTLTLEVARTIGSGAAEPVTRRYWRLPVAAPIRYRREQDYVDRFRELIADAVSDRAREARVGVLMSGGIDSTTVAATACGLPGHEDRVEAFTYYYEDLIDDEEADYAAVAARSLGIPLHRLTLDDDRTHELWRTADPATPGPMAVPMTGRMDAFFRTSGAGILVGLTGQGADPASHLLPEDAAAWLRRHPFETTWQAWRYRYRCGQFPRAGLRTAMRRRFSRATLYPPVYPPWLRPDLEQRLDLRARFERLHTQVPTAGAVRPTAHAILSSNHLTALLETYDPGYTKFAADVRHPWLDLRLVDFMLRLPPLPWCVEKHLVRRAMEQRLPRATLTRRKAPLPGYPLFDATLTDLPGVLEMTTGASRLVEFIDVARLQAIIRKPGRLRASEYEVVTRPLGVALWLRQFEEGFEKH